MTYSVIFVGDAERSLAKLDKGIQLRILKKVAQLERSDFESRHLHHGSPYFVEEVGGYRIAFEVDEMSLTKTIYFVGDHKQYEHWYSSQ